MHKSQWISRSLQSACWAGQRSAWALWALMDPVRGYISRDLAHWLPILLYWYTSLQWVEINARRNPCSEILHIFTDPVYFCSTWCGAPVWTFVQFSRRGWLPICNARRQELYGSQPGKEGGAPVIASIPQMTSQKWICGSTLTHFASNPHLSVLFYLIRPQYTILTPFWRRHAAWMDTK